MTHTTAARFLFHGNLSRRVLFLSILAPILNFVGHAQHAPTQKAPAVSLSSKTVSFKTQSLFTTSAPQTVTLTNSGTGPLTIISISATGDFAQANNCGMLDAKAKCTISVTFTPTAVGVRTGLISIVDNAADSPQSVALTGSGASPVVTFSPASLTFGRFVVDAQTSPVQTATVTNTGNTNVRNVAVTVIGDFSQTNNCPSTLASHTSCTVSVRFSPTAEGSRTGIVTIRDSAADSPQTLPLSGFGTRFAGVGNMTTAREFHTATLLNNGFVLVAGGVSNSVASAELYNRANGTFSATGNLVTARFSHTATLLNNGLVLLAGGFDPGGGSLASAELFNPATGTFSATGSLVTARGHHTATLLNNGMVLIAGGAGSTDGLASTELYNPATGTFSATGNLATVRYLHTATLLNNGMVLIGGGNDGHGSIASAELYNPANGTFSPTGALATGRFDHTATLLSSGLVLVAGGTRNQTNGDNLASTELYNPITGTFSATGTLATARYNHTATLLNNGMVLIVGGVGNGYLASGELYNPLTGTFSPTGTLAWARALHTATILSDGMVLIAGGVGTPFGGGPVSMLITAELYYNSATW